MKIMTALAALTLLFPFAASARDLVVGIPSTAKPFIFTDDQGRMTGFNVELAHNICARLSAQCRLEPTTFPKMLAGVADGTFDLGIGNALKTPERAEKMLFSRPIWRSTSSFVAHKSMAPLVPERIVARHKVCVVEKSQQLAWLSRQEGAATNILTFQTFRDVFAALTGGQCAVAMMPTLGALDFLSGETGKDFDYFGKPLRDDGLGGSVHIVATRGKPDLLAEMDDALERMSLDGTYRFLVSRYFPFDIQ